MTHPRLSLAPDAFGPLPPGPVLVLGARAGDDLGPLGPDLTVVQGFAPDHAALAAAGLRVVPEVPQEGAFAAAVVFLPRAKGEAMGRIAEAAARTRGPIWIDGAKTDGIESVLREMRRRGEVSAPVSKAHGKIFAARPGDLADLLPRDLTPAPGFVTRAGLFSAGEVDRGSALLAAALPAKLPARVADLGAGWGWLSAQILARAGVETLHMVEAEHAALACARRNVTDPRAALHWADALRWRPEGRLGAVITNPPFHTSRAADPKLGAGFILAAADMLALSGTLWMVANRHLPYEPVLRAAFLEVEEILPDGRADGAFKIYRAARPNPRRAA